MSRLKRRLLTVWRNRLPARLKLAYYASNGGRVSKKGPDPTWSYAGALPDGLGGTDSSGDPVVHDEGVWVGPAYTNELASGSTDLTDSAWQVTGAIVVDSNTFTTSVANDRIRQVCAVGSSAGEVYTGSCTVSGTGEIVLSLVDASDYSTINSVAIVLAATPTEYSISGSCVGNSGVQLKLQADADAPVASVTVDDPQLVASPYLHPYIPPGTSVVSAAGSTGGNGVGFDISRTQEVPDGVELWVNPSANDASISYDNDTGIATFTNAVDAKTVAVLDSSFDFAAGDRLLITAFIEVTNGAVRHLVYDNKDLVHAGSDISASGWYSAVISIDGAITSGTASDSISFQCRETGTNATISNISAQALETVPEPKSLAVRRALEGKPDGVELWDNNSATPSGGWADNGDGTWTHTGAATSELVVISDPLLVENQRHIYDVDLLSGSAVNIQLGGPPTTVNKHTLTSASNIGVLPAEGTSTYNAIRVITSNDGVTVRVNSVQALNPAITTVACLTVMGAGSNELSNGDQFSVLTASDVATDLITYGKDATGSYIAASDGTATAKVYTTWDRYDQIVIVGQTGNAGGFFRAGCKRYDSDGTEIDSSLQTSSWTACDGSFNPADYLRVALNSTVPAHLKAVETWDKAATEDEILKRLRKEVLK